MPRKTVEEAYETMYNDVTLMVSGLTNKLDRLNQEKTAEHEAVIKELREIKQQTIQHNGRMSAMEKWKIEIESRDRERDKQENASNKKKGETLYPLLVNLISGTSAAAVATLLPHFIK